MASLQKKGDAWYCQFSYGAKRHTITIGEVSDTEAGQWKSRTETLLMRLSQNLLQIPRGVSIADFILHDGKPPVDLELAQHPIHKDETYNEYVGNAARQALGRRKWNKRVLKVIGHVYSLVHYDVLYLGGGNAARVTVALPDNIHIASNDAGITGGIRLWDEAVWSGVLGSRAKTSTHRKKS